MALKKKAEISRPILLGRGSVGSSERRERTRYGLISPTGETRKKAGGGNDFLQEEETAQVFWEIACD